MYEFYQQPLRNHDEKAVPYPAPGHVQGTQGLPLSRLSLLAGHRLYVLLPGFAQPLGWREVMLWPVS